MKRLLVCVLTLALLFGMTTTTSVSKTDIEGPQPMFQIANQEKLVRMLEESGKLKKGATITEVEEVLTNYLQSKNAQFTQKGDLAQLEERRNNVLNEKTTDYVGVSKGKGKGKPTETVYVPSIVEDQYSGKPTEDRILAILINFPDYDGSSLSEDYTDMYYESYTKEHYEDLLFGDSYEGPNGESFISMKSYYEEQSGGSYTVTGKVAGWYTAKNPASYYGGNDESENDSNPRELVMEAIDAASADKKIDLKWFDQEDRYDLDGDGNLREPDGLVDHIMIFHASVGEEAGGGELNDDAIWSHRWNLGGVYQTSTKTKVDYWDKKMAAYDYTIQPIDAAAGVCAHEYGHDLGLPDEYDTIYSSPMGEPVSYWSIMSSGSWAGEISGTEPTGFSPYAKEFFAATIDERWFDAPSLDIESFQGAVNISIDEASTKGTNYDGLRIDIPNKKLVAVQPLDENGFYYSTSGNDLNTMMYTMLDLTNYSSVEMAFDINYKIEEDWDYAHVFVQDANGVTHSVQGNITTTEDPNEQNPGNGITGYSQGWVRAEFDLSAFVGQTIYVGIQYITDSFVKDYGVCIDNVSVIANGDTLIDDSTQTSFAVNGFITDGNGITETTRYYLIEWRNHSGVDQGLAHIRRGSSLMSFDPGMVVWFVDNGFEDNHVGNHPGNGFLGVVDASSEVLRWSDGEIASTKYQIHDAAFNVSEYQPMFLDYTLYYDRLTLRDNKIAPNNYFDDGNDYYSSLIPEAGKILPEFGLKLIVIGESEDQSVGLIQVAK